MNNNKEFRNALGMYTTGITVVTAFDKNKNPEGITVNSFTSLSLEPPLVLWCLGKDSDSFDVFNECENFTIHVLNRTQQEVSHRFSLTGIDKFTGIDWEHGPNNTPLLDESLSNFQCVTRNRFDGGDHVIIIGEVLQFKTDYMGEPLIYFQGNYRSLSSIN